MNYLLDKPNDLDEAFERIKKLHKENEKLKQENEKLHKENEDLKKIEKEFEEHKHECALANSRIPFYAKANKPARAGKLGAPKGHRGYFRKIPERIDFVKPLALDKCPECGSTELSEVQETRERIIEDLPVQKTIVTKYTIPRKYCRNCKKLVEPDVPDALPRARFGLFLMVYVAFLKIGLAIPENKIVGLLEAQYSLKLSQAEIVSMLEQLKKAFGSHYEELGKKIKEAAVKGIDETGWKENGRKHWLWAIITEEVAWYRISKSRSRKVVQPVLQNQLGKTLTHDRLKTYDLLTLENDCSHQICWAHILRNSKELAERFPEAGVLHNRLKSIFKKAKSLAPKGKMEDVWKLLGRIDRLKKLDFRGKDVRNLVESVCVKHRNHLFRFVTDKDVPSTNNWAERAIRKAVVIRKISGGNRSEKGSRITETLLSVIETLKLQGENPLTGMHRILTSVG